MSPGPRVPTFSARTRLLGLVGHPVSHSLSPAMHNAACRAAGLDALYTAFDVAPGALTAALAGARALGLWGLNVTVPHKEAALELAAEADETARLAGAANTLVPVPEGWRAHNTDAEGLVRALAAELGFDPAGRRCLIVGAGGAARGAALGLLRGGAQEILVANRNKERAETLVRDLERRTGARGLAAVPLEGGLARLGPEGLLVSATPAGLDPDGRWPWDLGSAPPGTVAYDLAYRSGGETSLVLQARGHGLSAASGLSMLLHQGALAFTLWTGLPAPVAAMRRGLHSNSTALSPAGTRRGAGRAPR